MDTKRIRKLRKEIITTVPKFPNDRATKSELESKHLTDLLLVYLSWAARLITPRPRTIVVENEARQDNRWEMISNDFSILKNKIEKGSDLTPYLSLKAQEKGYTPASSGTEPTTDKWADKDFLLNVMGFYHLHLGEKTEGTKISGRTDEVIFAKVDKETFHVVGIFDHSVFDKTDGITKEMSQERNRIWQIFDKYTMQGVPEGSVVIPTMITTSAHNMQIVQMAQEYVRIITEYESKLDDREYVNSLYEQSNVSPPNKPKFEWCLRGTDLGVYDKAANLYVVYRYGVN
jgi:hypothetical protein